MPLRPLYLAMIISAASIMATPALAAETRHQFLEPIQPDRRRQEKTEEAPTAGKLCYCRTVHERNSAGRVTWKVVCSEEKPEHGARKIRAPDCGALRNLPPS